MRLFIRCCSAPIKKRKYDSLKDLRGRVNDHLGDGLLLSCIRASNPEVLSRVLKQVRAEASYSSLLNAALTLEKYQLRLTCRPTPLGLFSGVAEGDICDFDEIVMGDLKSSKVFFYEDLEKSRDRCHEESIEGAAKIYVNPSIYTRADSVVLLLDSRDRTNAKQSLSYSEYEVNTETKKFLRRCGEPLRYEDAVKAGTEIFACSPKQAEDAISQMLEARILISAQRELLSPYVGTLPYPKCLMMQQLLTEGLGESAPRPRDDFLTGSPILVRGAITAGVSESSVDSIRAALTVFRLGVSREQHFAKMICELIESRFIGQHVRLTHLVCPKYGLGDEINRLLSGRPPEANVFEDNAIFDRNQCRQYVLRTVMEKCLESRCESDFLSSSIDIAMVGELDFPRQKVSGQRSTIAYVVEPYIDRDGGLVPYLKGIVAPASSWLARFSRTLNGVSELLVDEIDEFSAQHREALIAEVNYLPSGKASNVCIRENVCEYEISITGHSESDKKKICLSDLVVSLEDDRLVLRLEDNSKEVIPLMSTAFNWMVAGDLRYRLLAIIAKQYCVRPKFALSEALSELHAHPRIMFGNVILSPARKKVRMEKSFDRPDISEASADFVRIGGQLVFRYIRVGVGDQVLALDLLDELHWEIFKREAPDGTVWVTEDLRASHGDFVRDQMGNEIASEIIIPEMPHSSNVSKGSASEIGQTSETTQSDSAPKSIRDAEGLEEDYRRVFSIGSRVLSVYLYGSRVLLEELLLESLGPSLVECVASEALVGFFFIRYQDPDYHLRVRLLSVGSESREGVWSRIYRSHLERLDLNDDIRIKAVPYVREVSRYGGRQGVARSEVVFCEESALVCKLLRGGKGQCVESRSILAMTAILANLSAYSSLGLDPVSLIKNAIQSFSREFKKTSERSRLVSSIRGRIVSILTIDKDPLHLWERGDFVCAYTQFREVYRRSLKDRYSAHADSLGSITRSHIHMLCNRVFDIDPRSFELTALIVASQLLQNPRVALESPELDILRSV